MEKSATRTGPQVCDAYNHYMNGVDRADANRTRYDYDHRRDKWTCAALYTVFKIAIVNAWIIKRAMSGQKYYSQLAFIEKMLTTGYSWQCFNYKPCF